MRIKLVYPTWQRIERQTHYVLPPLGIAVAAAATPEGHEVSITDENVEPIDFDERVDLVGISTMLVSQAPRAFEIAAEFRARGVPVVLGGLTATCLPEVCRKHADAVVLGEAEGVWPEVVRDAERGALKPLYHREGFAGPAEIGSPRRDLLDPKLYTYRGIRMMDLLETSRGCRFGCFPCQVPIVTGRAHRMRPVEEVIEEMAAIDNDRIFIVDNSPEQNPEHEKALFEGLKRVKKRWVSHPISANPDTLKRAAESGCWLVYQALLDSSEKFRDKVKLFHDYGITVEATMSFGTDRHGPDVFKRMVDFLLETGVDLAEFTVLTPFPGSPFYFEMKQAGRILHDDWALYNAENVVFRPAGMTPEELQEGYHYAWKEFYREESQAARMFRVYRRLSGKDWAREIKSPEARVLPNQEAGDSALWGGVVDAGREEKGTGF